MDEELETGLSFYITCSRCEGRGYTGNIYRVEQRVLCSVCSGFGSVKRSDEISNE